MLTIKQFFFIFPLKQQNIKLHPAIFSLNFSLQPEYLKFTHWSRTLSIIISAPRIFQISTLHENVGFFPCKMEIHFFLIVGKKYKKIYCRGPYLKFSSWIEKIYFFLLQQVKFKNVLLQGNNINFSSTLGDILNFLI